MWHTTYMQRNRVNSWLLVVKSQIANLTPGLSFGHNLCFRCPNASCTTILDIYVSIAFQWYKELFNPLGFDACNHFLNIRESIGTPIPKVGVPLGVWRSIPHTLLHSREHATWLSSFPLGLQPCNPFALVANPRLGLWHSWIGALTLGKGRDQISDKNWTNKKNFMKKNTKTKSSPILRKRRWSNQQLNLTMNQGKIGTPTPKKKDD